MSLPGPAQAFHRFQLASKLALAASIIFSRLCVCVSASFDLLGFLFIHPVISFLVSPSACRISSSLAWIACVSRCSSLKVSLAWVYPFQSFLGSEPKGLVPVVFEINLHMNFQ